MSGLQLENGRVELLPLDLVDAPALAMREVMSDDGLADLAESIKALGLLQNLVVVPEGGRYRVAAGHRRRVALEMAGKTHAPCLVFPEGTPLEEAAKVAENSDREAVNPAAEATYYRWLLDNRCDGDVGKLVTLTRRTENYVQGRLLLTEGYAEVLDALRAGDISLGVAQELNKIHHELYRQLYLNDAKTQGLSVAAVRQLRQTLARDLRVNEVLADHAASHVAPSTEAPIESLDACPFCQSTADQHEMSYVRAHRGCLSHFRRLSAAPAN